MKYNIKVKI